MCGGDLIHAGAASFGLEDRGLTPAQVRAKRRLLLLGSRLVQRKIEGSWGVPAWVPGFREDVQSPF